MAYLISSRMDVIGLTYQKIYHPIQRYSGIMTKIQFELSAKPSKAEKADASAFGGALSYAL